MKVKKAKLTATTTPAIKAWESDPGSASLPDGGALIQLPIPTINSGLLPTAITQTAPAPLMYAPGTPEFRYWNLAAALSRCSEYWSTLLPGISWQVGSTLPVEMDFGIDLNAYYDRIGLKFFHATVNNRTVFSGESPDVVCHEQGHAILDSIKPQLWNAASIEAGAFHESFGDMSAILSGLQLPTLRQAVLIETNKMLFSSSRLSRMAEQLGWAIRQKRPSSVETDCLRNAVNSFFYQPPNSLPSGGPATTLSSEPHSFSRVFTGAFFEGLAGMFSLQPTLDENSLLNVSIDIGRILVNGIKAAPVVPSFFSQVASNMIQIANSLFTNIAYGQALRSAFVRHGILSPASSIAFTAPPFSKGMVTSMFSKDDAPELPVLNLSIAEYGLGIDNILVHGAADNNLLNITGAAMAIASVEPESEENAAKAFVEDLLRRGKLKAVQPQAAATMSMSITRPNDLQAHETHSHELVKEGGDYVLRRVRIDCNFHDCHC